VVENCSGSEIEMLGRTRIALAAIFLSVASTLAPVPALAIPVSTFVSQRDQSLQAKELEEAINNVINGIEKRLFSSIDADGSQKTEDQRRRDIQQADRIVTIVKNMDNTKIMLMIMDANRREPNVDLEKVIIAYIYQELQQPQSPAKKTAPNP
jgi:hypothetical protein